MQIGHYAPKIGEEGGIATYIRRVGRAQSGRGHTVFYFGRDATSAPLSGKCVDVPDDEALFTEARDLNLDLLHLHKSVETLPTDRVPTVRTMHGHQGGCPSGSRYLARSGEPCDRAYSVPGCLWGHLVDRCGSARPQNLMSNFSRVERELEQARRVPTYTVSDFLREQMVRAGCPPDRLRTIHSPAPEVQTQFGPVPENSPPRFLYLGRLVPEKGLGWVLRALAQTDTPVRLDVAGEGHQRRDLETMAGELGVRSRVTFHGWVEPADVPSLMRRARAVVFPSVWHEPAGLISLEAAAHGRSLIASQVGGIPEYARDGHALHVDPHDISGMAHALDRLSGDAELANRMGNCGRKLVQSAFSMEEFLERLETFYGRAQSPVESR
jgi:glycosyltransferase involved in cell wall biosynthesis